MNYPAFHFSQKDDAYILHAFHPKLFVKVYPTPVEDVISGKQTEGFKDQRGMRYEVLNADEFTPAAVNRFLQDMADWFENQTEFDGVIDPE